MLEHSKLKDPLNRTWLQPSISVATISVCLAELFNDRHRAPTIVAFNGARFVALTVGATEASLSLVVLQARGVPRCTAPFNRVDRMMTMKDFSVRCSRQ